jgi:triacylglycerol esterase/lipase EstA (alpha/beta hydrolase family)
MLPIVILPGYFARAEEYQPLAELLGQAGFITTIVPLRKLDWLPTVGGRSMVPILRQLHQTVQCTLAESGAEQVILVGHSAGGWIARIYLGEKPYVIHGDVGEDAGLWDARDRIHTLVTLGTPHISQEPWTQRNLDFVNNNYPGAFYKTVRYLCVAGKAVYGEQRWGSWLAYQSYKITIGDGNTWGDGITPIAAAHLAGAENLTLEGAKHAPTSGGNWYGSPEILPQWLPYLSGISTAPFCHKHAPPNN